MMRSCLKTSDARIFSAGANSLRAAARDPLTRAWSTSSRHARLVHSRHARKVGTSSQQGDTVLGALLESSLRVQHSIGSIESKQDAMAKNFSDSMAVQAKNFSDSMADQKLTHAKFAKNIVKQISEGQERVEASQERVEASQERFSDELFDVRQGVAKNGIFAQSAFAAFVVPPAIICVFGGSLVAMGIDTGNILLPAAITADLAKTVGGLAMAYGACGGLAFTTINHIGHIDLRRAKIPRRRDSK